MSKWKLEVSDDGDEVLIFDETHSLATWNLEDTDKCCYEILHLIKAAPELLETCEKALSVIRGLGYLDSVSQSEVDKLEKDLEKVVALAKNETLFDPPSEQQELDWSTW